MLATLYVQNAPQRNQGEPQGEQINYQTKTPERDAKERDTKPGTHLALRETKNNLEACVPRSYLGGWGGGHCSTVRPRFLPFPLPINPLKHEINLHEQTHSCAVVFAYDFPANCTLALGGKLD